MVHALNIAKNEEKELLAVSVFSKENTYLITETSNKTDLKWCSIQNTKTHDTAECRVHLQRSKTQVNCYNHGNDHVTEDCLKPKKEPTSITSVNTIFSTNAHTPLDICQNINEPLTALKLNDKNIL